MSQRRGFKRTFAKYKALHEPFRLEFTEGGMSAFSSIGQSALAWDYLLTLKEGKLLFLIYQTDNLFHIFPKRFLAGPDSVAQLRNVSGCHPLAGLCQGLSRCTCEAHLHDAVALDRVGIR